MDVGKRFLLLGFTKFVDNPSVSNVDTTQNVFGNFHLPIRIQEFDPNYPMRLKSSIQIFLCILPLEYHLLENFVVDYVGKFLGIDPTNAIKKILGFVLHLVLMWDG